MFSVEKRNEVKSMKCRKIIPNTIHLAILTDNALKNRIIEIFPFTYSQYFMNQFMPPMLTHNLHFPCNEISCVLFFKRGVRDHGIGAQIFA